MPATPSITPRFATLSIDTPLFLLAASAKPMPSLLFYKGPQDIEDWLVRAGSVTRPAWNKVFIYGVLNKKNPNGFPLGSIRHLI
jgi:hypothetical protein